MLLVTQNLYNLKFNILCSKPYFDPRKKKASIILCCVVWNGYCTFMSKEQNLNYFITAAFSLNSCFKTCCHEIEELKLHDSVSWH